MKKIINFLPGIITLIVAVVMVILYKANIIVFDTLNIGYYCIFTLSAISYMFTIKYAQNRVTSRKNKILLNSIWGCLCVIGALPFFIFFGQNSDLPVTIATIYYPVLFLSAPFILTY